MKKLILFFLLITSGLSAQENLFQKVKADLKKEYPELNMENKLIMINVWSVGDRESRNVNIQMDKTIGVFGNAILKGGRKGIIGVVVTKDEDKNTAIITLNKDNVTKTLLVSDLTSTEVRKANFSNVVFDLSGNEIYKNLPSEEIYTSIQKLITR